MNNTISSILLEENSHAEQILVIPLHRVEEWDCMWEEAEENTRNCSGYEKKKADKIPVSFKHCSSKAESGITLRYSNLSSYI